MGNLERNYTILYPKLYKGRLKVMQKVYHLEPVYTAIYYW
jgi:hypothetical protein